MASVAAAGDFDVRRFIGRGCYSIVYEVCKKAGPDNGSYYALKRFFLENDSSVKCVLRERHILERLALAEFQSPFLPVLFYALWHNYSSAFILREGAGCDLYDLLCHVGYLNESNARFYLTEVMCGLEHLHSLNIVHLDIKPENILFYSDGHVFVSDLDRSFDLTLGTKPTLDDFTGTPLFMAPEVAKGELIDVRSDIWSLGALVAEMVSGPIRPEAPNTSQDFQRARSGSYTIRGLKKFSKSLQSLFSSCLQKDYKQRPYLKDMKKLRFLKFVNWDKVLGRAITPPYKTSEIHHRPAREDNGPIKSTDKRVLDGAFSPCRPVNFASSKHKVRPDATKDLTRQNDVPSIITDRLRDDGYTLESLNEKFADFNFIHPSLQDSLPTVEEIPISVSPRVDDVDAHFSELKVRDSKPLAYPSLFRRTRSRGVSIGD